jgi:UDP-galactopyranose mutase
MFDTIIIGAGFAGSVLAERLATQKKQRVLVIDKRRHIGGNCYDRFDDHGILIHQYGPHLFHTDNSQSAQLIFSLMKSPKTLAIKHANY